MSPQSHRSTASSFSAGNLHLGRMVAAALTTHGIDPFLVSDRHFYFYALLHSRGMTPTVLLSIGLPRNPVRDMVRILQNLVNVPHDNVL